MGLATIGYWKIEDGTAFVLLNIDTDGWAGVSFLGPTAIQLWKDIVATQK